MRSARPSKGTVIQATKEQIIQRLVKAHEAYFDVTVPYAFAGRSFAGYAEFHSYGEQYVLSRRAKLWEVSTHEYLFFDCLDRLDVAALEDAVAFMKMRAIEKVQPGPTHMSSAISLVIVADAVDEDAARSLRATRYRKNFKLGFHGWSDLRLAAIDASTQRLCTNGAGKVLRDTLRANAGLNDAHA